MISWIRPWFIKILIITIVISQSISTTWPNKIFIFSTRRWFYDLFWIYLFISTNWSWNLPDLPSTYWSRYLFCFFRNFRSIILNIFLYHANLSISLSSITIVDGITWINSFSSIINRFVSLHSRQYLTWKWISFRYLSKLLIWMISFHNSIVDWYWFSNFRWLNDLRNINSDLISRISSTEFDYLFIFYGLLIFWSWQSLF